MTRPAIAIDRLAGGLRALRERGQMLALFTLSIFVLTGITALAVDVSWYWANTLKVQRTADAAALAGVVWLPGQPATAYATARDQAAKNGYTDAVGGVTITALKDATNNRRLNVTVSAPVGTYFMRVFGINTIQATRSAKAEYVLPVPMGSPENYYGVFGKLRTPGGGTTITTSHDDTTANLSPTATANPSNWTTPSNAYASDNVYATKATTTSPYQGLRGFAIPSLPSGSSVTALWVSIEGRASTTGCQVGLELSSNATASTPTWTTTGFKVTMPNGSVPAAETVQSMPAAGSPSLWGRSWTVANLSTLGVRLAYLGGTGCTTSTVSVDQVQVSVSYTYNTSVFVPDANITDPYSNSINPRGFWGTMMTQGGQKINGDAYLPQYDGGTNPNDEYDSSNYYNYAVEMPAGSSNGELWIYDPVFCATNGNGQYGTGDRYLGGSNNPAYAFYDLYDTKNTPYDLADDTIVASSGNDFKPQHALTDPGLNGPSAGGSVVDCRTINSFSGVDKGGYYHDRWYQLASGLVGGRTYRLHTTSEDPSNAAAMRSTNAHNSFALWSKATGGTPRIYGIGAMEVFTPLDASSQATFYLAQIDAVNAGKTMEIKLWDPGDTGALSASLEILQPTAAGYSPATFTYSAEQVASGAVACGSRSGTTSALTTNTGNNSLFNGCWLTLDITLPNTYSAPQPPGEPGAGWWKIRYTMGSQSTAPAFDLTTWQVQIRGNPVHLIVP